MKLLTAAFLLALTSAAVRAQTAPAPASVTPLGGYYVVFPTPPDTATHFDPNGTDMSKAFGADQTGYNHDGEAFKGFVRLRPSESSDDNAVDSSEYRKNVRSGKWTKIVNGE